jgi:hypothetical protein
MAVQVAVGADVHQNVEAELLSCTPGAQQLVVGTAMARTQVNDLLASLLR